MSTVEKLFVQIFDRKRQIIENLKYQKQLYNQHLLSKLVIQGIPPPPWLLNSDSHSETSDLTVLNKEELISGLLLPRPGPFASYPSGPHFLCDKPVITATNSGLPDETCAEKCAFSKDAEEDRPDAAPPCQVDDTEDTADINLLCHVGSTENTADIVPPYHFDCIKGTFNYVPMSPEDQTDTRFSNACKPEQSLVKIQRSRSRQKAMELRNSAKTSAKSRLGMEKDVGSFSESNMCRYGEQPGLRRSLGLDEPPAAFPAEICSNPDIIGNCSNKERSARGLSIAQATEFAPDSSSKEDLAPGNFSDILRFGMENEVGSFSESNICRYDEHLGLRRSLELDEPISLPPEICPNQDIAIANCSNKERSACGFSIAQSTGFSPYICSKEEVATRNCSDKDKIVDASGDSFVNPIVNEEAKEVEMGSNQKVEECIEVYGGRITRSRSSSQQSIDGAHLLNVKSIDTCVGLVTRSKSSLTQHAETIGKITGSKSGGAEEAETRFQRSISRDMSVKPKQLDFDEVEESNMNDSSTHLSGYISQDTLDERIKAHTIEKSGDIIAFSTEAYPRSFASKTLEAPGSENFHALSKGDKLSEQTLVFQDFVGNNAMDSSWPCYKWRRLEYQNPSKSSSTTLRVNSFKTVTENIANKSAWDEKENIHPTSQKSTSSHDSGAALLDCTILAKESNNSVLSSPSKELLLAPQVDCGKDEVIASACEHQKLSESDVSNVNQSIIAEPSDSFLEDGIVKTNGSSAASCRKRVSGGVVNDEDRIDNDAAADLMDSKMAVDQRKYHQIVHELKLSVGSPLMEFMDVAEADQNIPEFVSFVIGENAVDAQISEDELVHEEAPFLDNKVNRTCTPVSPFPTSSNLYFAPGIYSSVPNRLLENIDLQSDLLPSGSDLLRKFHSNTFSYPSRQYDWETKKPFLSPVGKGFESVTSKSGGSDRLGSSNLELTCFPILEDPESGEEDVNDVNTAVVKDSLTMEKSVNWELLDITRHHASSLDPHHADERGCFESMGTNVIKTDSSTRKDDNKESNCDIAVQNESSLAPDHADNRCSLGSVCTEISNLEMHNDSKKSSMVQRKSRQTRLGKENKGFSVGSYSSKKHSKPPSSRFSKPKLSGKSSLRSRGQSLSEKEKKCNNIVSNIKSFVPLVQQKQAAAVLPEKRDVKVKALQAAEAAKRAAELKENERKQKKEAMKLERARLEQENLKEMELKRKLKEEQKKKREAENEAKKRQREEEVQKEKERKKQRIEEARLQHRQAEEKLQAWKEESRCAAEEERVNQSKDCNEKIVKQFDKRYEGEDSEKPENDSVAVGRDRRDAADGRSTLIDQNMSIGSSATGKVAGVDVTETLTPNFDKNDKPNHRTSAPQSYDISPYQCSDDEDEVDIMPNKKFVPAWASKSCVAVALSSLQHVDPDAIFPPGSFCSLEEVLLPRRLPQK